MSEHSGPQWENMTVVDSETIPSKIQGYAVDAFARADVTATASQMEWRHFEGYYAARVGEIFFGYAERQG